MRQLLRSLVVLAAAFFAVPAAAETYPARPIRLYVAFPPGGAADIVARLVAQALSARLGQPVVVENKPGSGGNIVGELIAHAPPDGYSLLNGPDNLFTINPHLFAKMSFDPLKDIVPIATITTNQLLLAINPKVPARDFKEFIALAGRSDPALFYASIGNGSVHHLAMEMLKEEAAIKLTHVPYRGGGPAVVDLLAGQVQVYFGTFASTIEQVRAGKLRALAVLSATRAAVLPDVPAVAEFIPGFEASIYVGIAAPRGTPADIVDKLSATIGSALDDPGIRQRIAELGDTPLKLSAAEFTKLVAAETEKWAQVIRVSGVKAE